MTFNRELEDIKDRIEGYLTSIISYENTEKTIADAMKYSLLAGGKRVRPVLCLAIAKALGGDIKKALPFAVSIECIHTYSLIHDDLPAMDNDDLRRGIPTSHKKFGEANAILAGDGLLNLSYEIIFNELEKSNFDPYCAKIGSVISKAAGFKGMIAGQVIDIESENKQVNLERLVEMHTKKTGALIKAACITGAIGAKREDVLEKVSEYGENIGLVFQIVDDILDCTGESSVLGKMVGSDSQNDKSTFVSLIGIEESWNLSRKLTNKAIIIADELDSTGFLTNYTKYLLNRKS
ncbi:MAG: polyprenyl synthetase family protein [Clostridium sp.]